MNLLTRLDGEMEFTFFAKQFHHKVATNEHGKLPLYWCITKPVSFSGASPVVGAKPFQKLRHRLLFGGEIDDICSPTTSEAISSSDFAFIYSRRKVNTNIPVGVGRIITSQFFQISRKSFLNWKFSRRWDGKLI
jgi:hypothetical protein